MPRGVGRPYNRKEKQAVAREKSRNRLAASALMKGASEDTVRDRVWKTPGAKRDEETLINRRLKEADRRALKTVGDKYLDQSDESRTRERLTEKIRKETAKRKAKVRGK